MAPVAEEPVRTTAPPSTPTVRKGELIAILGVIAFLALGAAFLYSRRDSAGFVGNPASAARKTQCVSSIKQLSTAGMIYLADYDDHNFLKGTHMKALMPYTKNRGLFFCPTTTYAYATNDKLAGYEWVKMPDPSTTVFFFEGSGTTLSYPHSGTGTVSFADSSAKVIKAGTTVKFTP
jgi:hypothetical protein